MGFHTFPIERADDLEDPSRYRYCSREELVSMLGVASGHADAVVADLGSGTGFYTDDVAPFVDTCYAVDRHPEMHERYRTKGLPASVTCVAATIDSLPFPDDHLDAAYSTMTHHEYAAVKAQQRADDGQPVTVVDPALTELARVIRPGGRLVTVDWSADGTGDDGPPRNERFSLTAVTAGLEHAGFEIEHATHRPETLAVVARRTSTESPNID